MTDRHTRNREAQAGTRITTSDGRRIVKMEPYTEEWDRLAYETLKMYQTVRACRECGSPVIDGYCCTRCDSTEP